MSLDGRTLARRLLSRVAILGTVLAFVAGAAWAQCGGGYGGGGGGGSDCSGGGYCPPDCASCGPQMYLSINTGGPAWHLTGLENAIEFATAPGAARIATGWPAPGSEIALLALDRNGDGTINDGSELFGSGTFLSDGRPAPNGFEALAEFDTNRDGLIDARDAVWSSLLLWTDRNHDGIAQPDELVPITASPITALELYYRWSGARDRGGNTFRYEAAVHLGDQVRSFYEISYATRR